MPRLSLRSGALVVVVEPIWSVRHRPLAVHHLSPAQASASLATAAVAGLMPQAWGQPQLAALAGQHLAERQTHQGLLVGLEHHPAAAAMRGVRGALHHALRPFGLHSGAALRRSLDQLVVFVANPLNIVDLMAIMPLTSTGGTITILRVLRLARVARLAHLSNRLVMVRLLMRTLSRSGEALSLLVLLIFILCSFFGTVLFYVESGDYDPVRRTWLRPTLLGTGLEESPFRSIPVAMWWAVSTISTVGCMYPRLGETPPPAHRPPQRSHLFHHRAPSASSACPPSC